MQDQHANKIQITHDGTITFVRGDVASGKTHYLEHEAQLAALKDQKVMRVNMQHARPPAAILTQRMAKADLVLVDDAVMDTPAVQALIAAAKRMSRRLIIAEHADEFRGRAALPPDTSLQTH